MSNVRLKGFDDPQYQKDSKDYDRAVARFDVAYRERVLKIMVDFLTSNLLVPEGLGESLPDELLDVVKAVRDELAKDVPDLLAIGPEIVILVRALLSLF